MLTQIFLLNSDLNSSLAIAYDGLVPRVQTQGLVQTQVLPVAKDDVLSISIAIADEADDKRDSAVYIQVMSNPSWHARECAV